MWIIIQLIILTSTSAFCVENNLFPLLQLSPVSDNENCNKDIRLYINNLNNLTLWAHEMWDASAKIAAGHLRGNVFNFGHFHECVTISGPYETQYCLSLVEADVPTPNRLYDPFAIEYTSNDSVLHRIYKSIDPLQQSRHAAYMGMCISASCSFEDLQTILNKYLAERNHFLTHHNVSYTAKVYPNMCQTQSENKKVDIKDILLLGSVCFLLFALVLSSTVFERSNSKSVCSEKGLTGVWLSFSLYGNIKSLLRSGDPQSQLNILYGIKTLLVFLVILEHRILITIIAPISNFDFVEWLYRTNFSIVFKRGDYFTDIFFVTSGLLATYKLLTVFKDEINPFLIVIYRYLRLTPVYAFVVLAHATVIRNFASGPLKKVATENESDLCRTNWWANLLFLNNYVNVEGMCMIHSWYLPCEFHFFVIGIFVTKILSKNAKRGIALLLVLMLTSTFLLFATTVIYSRPAFLKLYPQIMPIIRFDSDFLLTYSKSHARIQPYLIGMITGYYYFKLGNSTTRCSQRTSWFLLVASLLIAIGCFTTSSKFYDPYYEYNGLESGIYAALHRMAFAVAIIGFILYISFGESILKTFLSWYGWIPISKLGYSAYLVHTLFQIRTWSTVVTPVHFDIFNLVTVWIGDVVLTFVSAFILYLTIEAPFQKIFAKLFEWLDSTASKGHSDKTKMS